VIETRKDQLLRMPHKFQVKDVPKKEDSRLKELEKFFEKPDGVHDFDVWLRMLLEARFVTDTPTIYNWKKNNGKPFRLDLLDGTTLHVLVDDAGRIPDPPNPAYQQIIKGLPMDNFTRDEIIYAPHNPRPYLPIYGLSEVEQIYLRLTSLVRKEIYVLDSWGQGTIPDLILSCPESWTPEQVATMQGAYDTLLSGNMALKSKMRLVPNGMKPILSKGTTAEILAALEKFEERSARIVCFCFSIPPTPFVSMMNRATASSLADEAATEGLYPLMNWSKGIITGIVRDWFGYPDIEYVWTPTPDVDPLKQAQSFKIYVDGGMMKRNEVRESLDLPPDPDGDVLTVTAGAVVTPLSQIIHPPPPPMLPKPGLGGLSGPNGKQPPQLAGKQPQRALPPPQEKPEPVGNVNGKPKQAVVREAEYVKVGKWLLPTRDL
jgi:hypothetical protein